MDKSHSGGRACWYCMSAGFALTNMALFLHPMSPEDFLGMAFSDPLLTVLDENGCRMAVFFWGGVSMMLIGLVCLLGQSRLFHRRLPACKPHLKAALH
jgi:hypothetical protein